MQIVSGWKRTQSHASSSCMMQSTAGLKSGAILIVILIDFFRFCQNYFVTRPDFKHLGNTRDVNSFTIRCQRGSAGRVLEDVGINANPTDGQHLARTFALIWCTRNQFKSTVRSNIYLLIYRRFYRAYNGLSISQCISRWFIQGCGQEWEIWTPLFTTL